MPEIDLAQLRALRRKATALNDTVVQDLEAFRDKNAMTYRQLPHEHVVPDDVRVSTTCTALMSLASNYKLRDAYEGTKLAQPQADALRTTMSKIFLAPWTSGGLPDTNPFTTIIVLRMAGTLASKGILSSDDLKSYEKNGKSLETIAIDIANGLPASVAVQDYPPTPPLGYWFANAVDQLDIELPEPALAEVTRWATTEFVRQVSLVTARNDAMMDPVAMGMAACLTARIRRILANSNYPSAAKTAAELPSAPELRNALDLVFNCQQDSGIWPKYFPLFHFPGGSNFCFSFELMEALLQEFDEGSVLRAPAFGGMERAVDWCEKNRHEYRNNGRVYRGWNSGGQLTQLAAGVPESWATGVIHMFLSELGRFLSGAIQRRILEKYSALSGKEQGGISWDRLIKIGVILPHEEPTTVQTVIEEEILDPIRRGGRKEICRIEHRRSALLFGPPGTSKSSLVRALAREIEWPYVEITPSHFLKKGLEQIYVQADEVFEDMMDLSGVVLLFDEMDALVQRRTDGMATGVPLDVTRQFLTTSMLPKLTALHDRGAVVFFMATNHQKGFDAAIKRPGRFDLLLCMGPPEWKYKLDGINAFLPKSARPDGAAIAKRLRQWASKGEAGKSLDLFTFGEMRALLEHICRVRGKGFAELKEVLDTNEGEAFRDTVRVWRRDKLIALWGDKDSNPVYADYLSDCQESRRQ